MEGLEFRNAGADDVKVVVGLLLNAAIVGSAHIATLEEDVAKREDFLRALVAAGDTEYGYEQVTLAELGGRAVGLFLGFPRDTLAAIGPRTLSLIMRGRSPLSWPGLISRQSKIARAEPPPPPASYLLRALCLEPGASDEIVKTMLGEAVAEAETEECTSVAVNVFEPEMERALPLLTAGGFMEHARRPVADKKISRVLGNESVQMIRPTAYVAPPDDSDDYDEAG
ncbi:MAG: hypothetical protein WEB00_04440 [Dehalococcoidia bacterium]